MSFPDSIRNEALKKAQFMCVACHAPFVEVHHIIPHGEAGPDTLDNAAPLCAGCHGIYGANPVFRNQIRQMRDNWYDVCEKKFGSSSLPISQKLNEMLETLSAVRADQLNYQNTLDQIKKTLIYSLSGTFTAINSAKTVEEIATVSGSAIFIGSEDKEACPYCGNIYLPTIVLGSKCTFCGMIRSNY